MQQLVDLAVKINAHAVTSHGMTTPADYHQSFAAAADLEMIARPLADQLAPSTGLRNRLVHEYDDLDLDIVAHAIAGAVSQYDEYCRQVARWLRDQAD